MRHFTLLLALTLFGCTLDADAQYRSRRDRYEFNGMVGMALYQGDLSESIVSYMSPRAAIGASVRINFTKQFSIRPGIDYAQLYANDNDASAGWRKKRALAFFTHIYDFYIVPEWHFLTLNSYKPHPIRFTAYAGIGVFHFNPQAKYYPTQKYYDLQPLGTEGQGMLPGLEPYRLTQAYYPVGLAVSYKINRNWSIGVDMRANKVFSDYLDDVSDAAYVNRDLMRAKGDIYLYFSDPGTKLSSNKGNVGPRGNASDDWFYYAGVTVGYMFKKFNCYNF